MRLNSILFKQFFLKIKLKRNTINFYLNSYMNSILFKYIFYFSEIKLNMML